MKPTVTLRWKALGFAGMIAVGALLAIMPSRLSGASLETRLAEIAATMPPGGYTVKPVELAGWIVDAKPLVLVDVRDHWAFDEFHVEGAEHRALGDLVTPASVEALPDDRPIVIVGGESAGQAAALLRLSGKDAWALDGGIAGWWRDVLTPASADPSLPESERPSIAAQRVAWRARFLGSASAGATVSPGAPVPSAPPAPAPKAGGKPTARGKGC